MSADFVINLKETEHQKYKSTKEIKYDAINLKRLIDEGRRNNNYADNIKISEVAVMCSILRKL